MISRRLSPKILQYCRQYPVVLITGPRQSGKTTLCQALFPDRPYVSLEDPDQRHFAFTDPRGFLARFPEGAVLDEVQRAPELFSYIQTIVDRTKLSGMFVLTGSQQFEMMAGVSQSLAGRVAIARLLPFTLSELDRAVGLSLDHVLYKGFYPRIHDLKLNPTEALSFYVQTYVERDVRQLLGITDLARFEVFLRLCAGRTGQILNLSALGSECGISHNTAKSWLSVLEASYVVRLLRPFHANLGKRLVKSPKIYFLDVGLAAYLLRIRSPDHIHAHPLRGALFETLIVSEILKETCHAGLPENAYFFRDHQGHEVDLVLDQGDRLDLVEIKAGQTIDSDFFRGLDFAQENLPVKGMRFLLYGGEETRTQHETLVLPWRETAQVLGLKAHGRAGKDVRRAPRRRKR